ncbi:MAG TPA: hypothetical protein ENN80_00240, partial [Candidatus Hydrogenedentes bacterium]|nr:hypothetical protein [Candidatus Hydrogenedentota bacterium]
MRQASCILCITLTVGVCFGGASETSPEPPLLQLAQVAGVEGGLVVVLGADRTACDQLGELAKAGSYLVQALVDVTDSSPYQKDT